VPWPGGWAPRHPPLEPVAAVAVGADRAGLAAAALAEMQAGRRFSAWVCEDLLVIGSLGDPLPWAPGLTYVGAEAGLLLPTHQRPRRDPSLMAAWCRTQGLEAPVLVWPDGRLLPLGPGAPCPPEALEALCRP
jgi:hypothetical protein